MDDRNPHLSAPGAADGGPERLEIAYLDRRRRLVGTSRFAAADNRFETVPLRRIAQEALAADAVSVLLVHDHPGEDDTPDDNDYDFTRRLARVLQPLGIRIEDHLILSSNVSFSFRLAGLL